MTRLWWATAWHSSFTSLTWKCNLWAKSTTNIAKPSRTKSEKAVISSAITLTIFDQKLHWTNQKNEIGRIQIWNIGTKQIQVKEIKKSVCTASLHKGGQMGGGGSRGSSEIIWGEKFSAIGSNALSTHGRIQLYPILPTHILFWLWKWPLKLKYLFFRVSFSRLTFKSGGDPV